jgi:hypothetical protein
MQRWPGTDTLRYHFGQFTQTLEAAGLPGGALVFELSLLERVEAARRLAAAGEPTAAIADHPGRAPDHRARLPARPSLPRLRHGGRLPCRALPALRARAAAGTGPLASVWVVRAPRKLGRRAPGCGLPGALARVHARGADRGSKARGGHPRPASRSRRVGHWLVGPSNATSVVGAFGSWAPVSAGLEPPARRRWSDEEIVAALRDTTNRHGRPPLSTNWRRAAPDHPTAALVQARFGSWRAPSRPPAWRPRTSNGAANGCWARSGCTPTATVAHRAARNGAGRTTMRSRRPTW